MKLRQSKLPSLRQSLAQTQDWERLLILMSEIFEEWIKCQRAWMYLEPIFSSDDIMRQLPTEGKRFVGVDRTWRKLLGTAANDPDAISFCKTPRLLPSFAESNLTLEMVQKGLAEYLETKRAAFARFYFLSNDELLEILSQAQDPQAVQPHLRKCFEAVQSVTMQGSECEMSEMISPEKEHVAFLESSPIVAYCPEAGVLVTHAGPPRMNAWEGKAKALRKMAWWFLGNCGKCKHDLKPEDA